MSVSEFSIHDYAPEMAQEINLLWRLSFDLALGIEKRAARDSIEDQLKYLRDQLVKQTTVLVARDRTSHEISGFMALRDAEIEQLYIHPDYQNRGLGRQFIELAKDFVSIYIPVEQECTAFL